MLRLLNPDRHQRGPLGRAAASAVVTAATLMTASPAAAEAIAFKNMGLMRACLTVVEYAGQLGAAASGPDGAMEKLQRAMLLDREVEMFEDAAGPTASATLADADTGLTAHRRRAAACAAHGDCSAAAAEDAMAFAEALKAACVTDYRSAP